MLIYILYLVGIVAWIVPIVAVVLAYIYRKDCTGWLESHNTYQIRTFWIGLLYGFISVILMFVGVGFLLIIVVAIWMLVRCIRGLQWASRREPVPNPQTWLI